MHGSIEAQTVNDTLTEEYADENTKDTFMKEYLKAEFLASVPMGLYYARKEAHLTQQQVAEQLNTYQSVIAKVESDRESTFSFRRYIEYALACDVVPIITYVPIEDVIDFVTQHPGQPLTLDNIQTNTTT